MSELDVVATARGWLAELESCVRDLDFARARSIFASDVVGFGSRASMVVGLDALEHDQWRRVWGVIRDFTFLVDGLKCGAGGDEAIWLACPWTSEGRSDDGSWIDRPGRMTAVLRRTDDVWVAVHTHFSLAPRA